MMITLTICVTTYNRWDMCLKALNSVCEQEGVSFEVILVDDFSTDPMPQEVADFIEAKQIRYVRHEHNKGLAAARNTAIEHARGEYFSFCDDDDQWPQGHAAGLVKAMQENANANFLASDKVLWKDIGFSWDRQLTAWKHFQISAQKILTTNQTKFTIYLFSVDVSNVGGPAKKKKACYSSPIRGQ